MPIVSQCPLCLTAFRVSELQIAAAEGLVRCGACGHIFDARLHRLGEPSSEEPAEPSAAELNQAYIADLFSETTESVWETGPPIGEADIWGDANREIDQETPANGSPPLARFELLDTAAEHAEEDTPAQTGDEPEGETLAEHAPQERLGTAGNGPEAQDTTGTDAEDEAEVVALDPTADVHAADVHAAEEAEAVTVDVAVAVLAAEQAEAVAVDAAVAPLTATEPEAPDEPDPEKVPGGLAPRIAPLPVEMELVSTAPRHMRRSRAWSVACALAGLVLAAQYVWFNREQPRFRPLYESACALTGCSVPLRRELQLIRLDTLVIKPAAGRADVLVAEAIITNRATFPQRFPALELVFTDMDGHTVASRVFEADEYLENGTGAGRVMGSQESVRAHLALMDPGEDATNYRVYLRESGPGGA